MYIIGFATKFYTLWDVNTYEFWDARKQRTISRTSYQYMRNLSFELPAAEQKVRDFMPEGTEYKVNLELRGHASWNDDKVISETPPDPNAAYHFSFGKYRGIDIRTVGEWELKSMHTRMEEIAIQIALDGVDRQLWNESESVLRDHHLKDCAWQLHRAMKQENTMRRRACARRRLIELGELVRRDWVEKRPLFTEDPEAPVTYSEIKRKWMPRKLAEWHANIGDKKGLHYKDGARVELEIRKLKEKMFESQWGTLYIVNYVTPANEVVTYKGGTPPKASDAKFIKIKATIKHDRNETFIQRIKM